MEYITNLIVHLFQIWEYDTFKYLLMFLCAYMSVKIVRLMARSLL